MSQSFLIPQHPLPVWSFFCLCAALQRRLCSASAAATLWGDRWCCRRSAAGCWYCIWRIRRTVAAATVRPHPTPPPPTTEVRWLKSQPCVSSHISGFYSEFFFPLFLALTRHHVFKKTLTPSRGDGSLSRPQSAVWEKSHSEVKRVLSSMQYGYFFLSRDI